MNCKIYILFPLSLLLVACSNHSPLGYSVANMRYEQTYDHQATNNNKDLIPPGTGARMQASYDAYTGQSAYDAKAESVMGSDLADSTF